MSVLMNQCIVYNDKIYSGLVKGVSLLKFLEEKKFSITYLKISSIILFFFHLNNFSCDTTSDNAVSLRNTYSFKVEKCNFPFFFIFQKSELK